MLTRAIRTAPEMQPMTARDIFALLCVSNPTGSTRHADRMKFESSPTQPVFVVKHPKIFLIRHTATPDTGPIVIDASIAGTSEKSKVIKLGIIPTLKPKNSASTIDSAAISAVNTNRRTSNLFAVFMFSMITPFPRGKRKPFQRSMRTKCHQTF